MTLEMTTDGLFSCPKENCDKKYKNRQTVYEHVKNKHKSDKIPKETEKELNTDNTFMEKVAVVLDTNTVVDKTVSEMQELLTDRVHMEDVEDVEEVDNVEYVDMLKYTLHSVPEAVEENNFNDIALGANSLILSLRHGELEELLSEEPLPQEIVETQTVEVAASCGECGKVCETEGDVMEHMRNDHKDCEKCDIVEQQLKEKDETIKEKNDIIMRLKNELKKVKGVKVLEKVFICELCKKEFTSSVLFRKHMRIHHVEIEKIELRCNICKVVVKNKHELKEHRQKSCKTPAAARPPPPPKASAAPPKAAAAPPKAPTTPVPAPRRQQPVSKPVSKTTNSAEERELDCEVCQTIFNTPNDVYSHANRCNNSVGPKICKKCKRELVSKSALNKHEKVCHGPEGQSIATVVSSGSGGQAPSTSTWQNVTIPKCTNGDNCPFQRQGRCKFQHKGKTNKVAMGPSERKCLNGDKCNLGTMCAANFNSHTKRAQSTVCKNGPSCRFLKQNRCHFIHSNFPSMNKPQRM